MYASDLQTGSIIFIAHRGGITPEVPENSLSAFQNAIDNGAHAIEVDLRISKDGEIVIMHDETVDRTTNGHGRVTDQTILELKKLDLGNDERIPTYEETLQLVSGTGVDIIRLWPKWIYADQDLVQKVHLLGKPVWTTAGDIQRYELEKLINLGVNGILLDRLNLINVIVNDMKKNSVLE
jgi:glycerophosphoryl diester phosphodiesterase